MLHSQAWPWHSALVASSFDCPVSAFFIHSLIYLYQTIKAHRLSLHMKIKQHMRTDRERQAYI